MHSSGYTEGDRESFSSESVDELFIKEEFRGKILEAMRVVELFYGHDVQHLREVSEIARLQSERLNKSYREREAH